MDTAQKLKLFKWAVIALIVGLLLSPVWTIVVVSVLAVSVLVYINRRRFSRRYRHIEFKRDRSGVFTWGK